MGATPEQMADAAKICAVLDDVLDELVTVAREALKEHGPVTARAEITVAMITASELGGTGRALGLGASAILRLAQLEQIDAATGGERP